MYNTTKSPLDNIDVSFANYVNKRKTSDQEHMINGVPDYSFALDYELRAKLLNIPHFYSISKKITSTFVAQEIQALNQQALAVGPNQFPEIYQMGVECAHKLGIGVPNIFVLNSPGTMNAYTIAADDASPIIVLYSAIIERTTPGELKAVIAHECGHIHNNHGVMKTVVNCILNGFTGTLGFALSVANMALMQLWTRAGEVTADRAAMICADNVEDSINVESRLLTGGLMGDKYSVNIDALREQLEITMNNPSKIQEILSDHPSAVRRIFAEKEFEECETFYKWRPELKRIDGIVRSKEETDARCKKLINILDNK